MKEVNDYILKIPHPKDEFKFKYGLNTVQDKTSFQKYQRFISVYRLSHKNAHCFELHFSFVLLVHGLLPTFMDLRLDFAAPTQRFAVFFLTPNMLVERHSDFLALDF